MNCMRYLDVLLSESTTSEASKALRSLANQLSSQPDTATCLLERLFHPKASGFLRRLKENISNEEFLLSALNCIDKTVQHYQHESRRENTKFVEASEAIGETLLQLLYQSRTQVPLATNNSFALTILSILVQVTTCSSNFAQTHISELLGIARAHVNFGLQKFESNSIQIKPEKVQPSHQLSAGSSDELEADSSDMQKARCAAGGRVSKKRKPRSLTKSAAHHTNQSNHWRNLELNNLISDIKTSDSDASASEVETGGQTNVERLNRAKVRQTAINLMGVIAARVKDRRILYAYWHGFFEISKCANGSVRSDLPYIALHDPNSRCRFLALQVLAQLIFNSKGFLQQAECEERRCTSTFTHFAHDLGLQVLSLFDELTQVLSSESSLSVLTQALKCVAVLVQAMTPFKRFKPRDFVLTLVREVRRLTGHRDFTIQVAALMVMEFLIDAPELTPEISQAIGMPHVTQLNNEKRINEKRATDLLEIDNSFEEILESDCEDSTTVQNENNTLNNNESSLRLEIEAISATKTKIPIPWLLHRALQNLNDRTVASISVRLESLQLLSAMAQHFHLLHTHLNIIATSIENAFKDPSVDLRLCGARTLDTIAHQIGRTLLETVATTSDGSVAAVSSNMRPFEEECFQFWGRLLPVLMTQINVTSTSPAVDTHTSIRVGLCDALSNIGLIVFERQPFTLQMNLIGFLSGIANDPNEEVILRVAAVRALAVYVLFPTLRDNLVFVENLAESVLRLVSDANLNVRVKSLWALGNISDALLIQSTSSHERVSDALLWHMITATTIACSDNDKVRCNAVRALGNLLRLLRSSNFETPFDGQTKLQSAICKLIDCLRLAGSAKVKWNTCYAIGNLLQNTTLFHIQSNNQQPSSSSACSKNFDWQSKLFLTLANVIVHNNNFKVRINAATALTHITERSHFGAHFEILCKSLLDAIEQSQNLDNFYEYNHRDHLQEQLCLATCHLLRLSLPDDFQIFRKYLETRFEVVRNINVRVVNRMVPEKSKGILACAAYLQQQLQTNKINYTHEQQNAIKLIIKAFDNQ